MTRDKLQALSRKDLGDLARKRGIAGWHELSKDALITKLLRQAARAKTTARPEAKNIKAARAKVLSLHSVSKNGTNGTHKPAKSRDDDEDERPKFDIDPAKDLSVKSANGLAGGYTKDRIVVMVRDPFWLHTYWELTHQSIQRAEAALGQDWHTAKPILRIVDVSTHDTTSTSEAIVKDIEIHGGCQN